MDNKEHCTYCLFVCITPCEQPHYSYKMLTIKKNLKYTKMKEMYLVKGKVTGNLISMFQSQELQKRRKFLAFFI